MLQPGPSYSICSLAGGFQSTPSPGRFSATVKQPSASLTFPFILTFSLIFTIAAPVLLSLTKLLEMFQPCLENASPCYSQHYEVYGLVSTCSFNVLAGHHHIAQSICCTLREDSWRLLSVLASFWPKGCMENPASVTRASGLTPSHRSGQQFS